MKEYTETELKTMSDNDITNHFLEVRSYIILNNKKIDTKNLEIYYCYIAKEIQNRNKN